MRKAREFVDFRRTLWQKKPYFGSFMSAGQLNVSRKQVMQRLLAAEIKKKTRSESAPGKDEPFRVLEVGSWAGCSCIAWCETAKQLDCPILVYCVDPWEWYEQYLGLNEGSHYRSMDNALATDRIFSLFLHNIGVLGYRDRVRVMRGYSSEILPILRPESFDLIYIDGNHSYSYVSEDIKNAKHLVKNGGIICGDDAEMLFHEVDGDFCRNNAEKDYVSCPKARRAYHPGITLALHEEFDDKVSLEEGFWSVAVTG